MGSATPHRDSTGRKFNDELTSFMVWYLYDENRPKDILVPFNEGHHFVEGVRSITIYRDNDFQVQLFIVDPDTTISPHMHPNVDSYEVLLSGMTLTYKGEEVLNYKDMKEVVDSGLGDMYGSTIRVMPNDIHGGESGPEGGSFLSIQRWLNGVTPSSVGNDWVGETMGSEHSSQIARNKDRII